MLGWQGWERGGLFRSAVVISGRDGGSGHDGVGEHDGEGTASGPLLWEEPTLLADKTGWGMWEEDRRQG